MHQQKLGTPEDNPLWDAEFAREIKAKLNGEIDPQESGPLDHDFAWGEVQEAVDALWHQKSGVQMWRRHHDGRFAKTFQLPEAEGDDTCELEQVRCGKPLQGRRPHRPGQLSRNRAD